MLSKKKNYLGFVDLISLVSIAVLLLTVTVSVNQVFKNQNIEEQAAKKKEKTCADIGNPKARKECESGGGSSNKVETGSNVYCAACGGFYISGATQTCNQAAEIKCGNSGSTTTSCTSANEGQVVVYSSGANDYRKCVSGKWTTDCGGTTCKITNVSANAVPAYLQEEYNKAKQAETETKVETVIVPKPYTTDADQSDKVEPIPSNISLNEATGNTSGTNPFISAETQQQQQVIEEYLARTPTPIPWQAIPKDTQTQNQQNLQAQVSVGTKKPNGTNSLCSKNSDCISNNCVPLPGGVKACFEPSKDSNEIAQALGYQTTPPEKLSIWDRFRGTQDVNTQVTQTQTGIVAQGSAVGETVEEDPPKTPTIVTNVKNWLSELVTPQKVVEKPYTTDSEQAGQIDTTQNPTIGTTTGLNRGEGTASNVTRPEPINIWDRASSSLTEFLTGEKTAPTTTTSNPTIGTDTGLNRGEGNVTNTTEATNTVSRPSIWDQVVDRFRGTQDVNTVTQKTTSLQANGVAVGASGVVEKPFWQEASDYVTSLFGSLDGGSTTSKLGSVIQRSDSQIGATGEIGNQNDANTNFSISDVIQSGSTNSRAQSTENDFDPYFQWDEDLNFDNKQDIYIFDGCNKKMSQIGCGPVTVANILGEHTNSTLSPSEIVKSMKADENIDCDGSSWQGNMSELQKHDFQYDVYSSSLKNIPKYTNPSDIIWIAANFDAGYGSIQHHAYFDGYTMEILPGTQNPQPVFNLVDPNWGDQMKCVITSDTSFDCSSPSGGSLKILGATIPETGQVTQPDLLILTPP